MPKQSKDPKVAIQMPAEIWRVVCEVAAERTAALRATPAGGPEVRVSACCVAREVLTRWVDGILAERAKKAQSAVAG